MEYDTNSTLIMNNTLEEMLYNNENENFIFDQTIDSLFTWNFYENKLEINKEENNILLNYSNNRNNILQYISVPSIIYQYWNSSIIPTEQLLFDIKIDANIFSLYNNHYNINQDNNEIQEKEKEVIKNAKFMVIRVCNEKIIQGCKRCNAEKVIEFNLTNIHYDYKNKIYSINGNKSYCSTSKLHDYGHNEVLNNSSFNKKNWGLLKIRAIFYLNENIHDLIIESNSFELRSKPSQKKRKSSDENENNNLYKIDNFEQQKQNQFTISTKNETSISLFNKHKNSNEIINFLIQQNSQIMQQNKKIIQQNLEIKQKNEKQQQTIQLLVQIIQKQFNSYLHCPSIKNGTKAVRIYKIFKPKREACFWAELFKKFIQAKMKNIKYWYVNREDGIFISITECENTEQAQLSNLIALKWIKNDPSYPNELGYSIYNYLQVLRVTLID